MVLNFFKVFNHTSAVLKVVNNNDHRDDYIVGPNSQARHDAWLSGHGRAVEICVVMGAEPFGCILMMWDENWNLKWRSLAGDRFVKVDSNKDFMMEVFWNKIVLHCFGGYFNGRLGEVTIPINLKKTKGHSKFLTTRTGLAVLAYDTGDDTEADAGAAGGAAGKPAPAPAASKPAPAPKPAAKVEADANGATEYTENDADASASSSPAASKPGAFAALTDTAGNSGFGPKADGQEVVLRLQAPDEAPKAAAALDDVGPANPVAFAA